MAEILGTETEFYGICFGDAPPRKPFRHVPGVYRAMQLIAQDVGMYLEMGVEWPTIEKYLRRRRNEHPVNN